MKARILALALGSTVAGTLGVASVAAQEQTGEAAARSLQPFLGVWEVNRRGPGGGREGPGARPRGDAGAADFGGFGPRAEGEGGERTGPRPDRPRGGGGPGEGRRPPPGGPDGPDGPEGEAPSIPGLDIEGLDRGDRQVWRMMTPAGRAAFAAMNPRDLPANNCLSNGLPSLVGIPDVQAWSVEGAVLTIRYANFNTVRQIYLDGRAPEGPPTLLGHSTGRWEGDTFVVTTTHLIATPGGLARNAPGSASRSYVERYRLAGGGEGITGDITIHDPDYLTRDSTRPIGFSRAPEGVEVPDDIACSVEAAQRYLD
jgi:hypothetical protein